MQELFKKYPLVTFYILAYLLSWIVWIPLAFCDSWDRDIVMLIMLLGVLGPMGAGYIVSKVTDTSGFFWSSTFKYRVSWQYYLVTLGLPLVVLGIIHIIIESAGKDIVYEDGIQPGYIYPIVLIFMFFVGGGLEEPGWRGFAQSRMLEHFNPIVASIILGIIWTYWHAPLYFIRGSFQHNIQIGWYTLGVTSLAVIMTWQFIKAEGSALMAIAFHAGVNAINMWIPEFRVPAGSIEFTGFAILESIWFLVALVIVGIYFPLFFKKFESTDPLLVMNDTNIGQAMQSVASEVQLSATSPEIAVEPANTNNPPNAT